MIDNVELGLQIQKLLLPSTLCGRRRRRCCRLSGAVFFRQTFFQIGDGLLQSEHIRVIGGIAQFQSSKRRFSRFHLLRRAHPGHRIGRERW